MKLKQAIPAAFLCALLAAAPAAASANSGPAYWESAPSYSVTPLKDCPVAVEREDLSFDFSKNRNDSFSPSADVSAAYRMKNPTDQTVKVQMAFPLIDSLPDLLPVTKSASGSGLPSISVDGKAIPFEILPGDEVPEKNLSPDPLAESGSSGKTSLPGFDEILKSVSTSPATRKIVTGSGRRYRITANQDCAVQARTTGRDTYLLSRGFDSMESDGTTVRLTCRQMKKGGSVSVFALGGAPVITPVSPDGKPDPAGKLNIQASDCTVDDFVAEMLNGCCISLTPTPKFLSRLIPRVEDNMDASFLAGTHAHSEINISDFLEKKRLVVLCFETEFPAAGEHTVTVRYAMSGSMDSRKTQNPVYAYAYLLNPAKGWAGFKDLNISITPPESAPNLVASSLSFTKSAKGVYTASLPSLPQNDLTFSLYRDSQTAPKQSLAQGIVTFLLCAAAVAAAVWLTVHLYRRKHGPNGGRSGKK